MIQYSNIIFATVYNELLVVSCIHILQLGITKLMWAVMNGNVDTVQTLINANEDVNIQNQVIVASVMSIKLNNDVYKKS